ncbi:transcriptional adaptor [Theileria orientalis]|uniref:Transcriptional adaptor n=1 Tax=Theileria orientalis TaxID=68886 RepID=A0A976M4F1_THEOR|nr:transcriptional adaptor [Theileria orientalis]
MENNNVCPQAKNADKRVSKSEKTSATDGVMKPQSIGTKCRPHEAISKAQAHPKLRENDSSVVIKAIGSYVQCNICSKLCSRQGHIKCAECIDFNICIKCFCSGLEKPDEEALSSSFVNVPLKDSSSEHLNTHKYIPVGPSNFALFSKDWSAEQELLLIDAISKYGLGNWTEVSDMVTMSYAGYKTEEECEAHYYQYYLNSATAPLPDTTSLIYDDNGKPLMVPHRGPRPLQDKPKPGIQTTQTSSNKPQAKPQIIGYWPLRGDFDIEYDNDAELILADMEFRPDDTPEQIELKLSVIEIYNSKLDERIYRKKIIIERGLLDTKSLQQKERKYTTEEKELYNLFKPFLRFQTPEEHDHTIRLIVKERKLRSRLYQLMIWKTLGLESAEDIKKYEDKLQRIDYFKEVLIKQESDPSRRHEKRLRTSSFETETTSTSSANKLKLKDFMEENEIEFCESLQLPPIAYFLAKRVLLQELACNTIYSVDDMCNELRIDGTKQGRIFDFLLMLSPKALRSMDQEVADLSKATLDKYGFIDTSNSSTQITVDTTASPRVVPVEKSTESSTKTSNPESRGSHTSRSTTKSTSATERPLKQQKLQF